MDVPPSYNGHSLNVLTQIIIEFGIYSFRAFPVITNSISPCILGKMLLNYFSIIFHGHKTNIVYQDGGHEAQTFVKLEEVGVPYSKNGKILMSPYHF